MFWVSSTGASAGLAAEPPGDNAVQGGLAGSVDKHDEREADGEEMIFEAFAFLMALPVHEESVGPMHSHNHYDHDFAGAERGHRAQESGDQTERAGESEQDNEWVQHLRQRCFSEPSIC